MAIGMLVALVVAVNALGRCAAIIVGDKASPWQGDDDPDDDLAAEASQGGCSWKGFLVRRLDAHVIRDFERKMPIGSSIGPISCEASGEESTIILTIPDVIVKDPQLDGKRQFSPRPLLTADFIRIKVQTDISAKTLGSFVGLGNNKPLAKFKEVTVKNVAVDYETVGGIPIVNTVNFQRSNLNALIQMITGGKQKKEEEEVDLYDVEFDDAELDEEEEAEEKDANFSPIDTQNLKITIDGFKVFVNGVRLMMRGEMDNAALIRSTEDESDGEGKNVNGMAKIILTLVQAARRVVWDSVTTTLFDGVKMPFKLAKKGVGKLAPGLGRAARWTGGKAANLGGRAFKGIKGAAEAGYLGRDPLDELLYPSDQD